jgi:hypothetical protein
MSELNNNDKTKYYILNNNLIEEKLHVIAVISNPCNYKIRYSLAEEFFSRMEKENNIILYIVELVYGNQPFCVTSATNKNHLQLRTDTPPLWHKENMINLGVKYLLPNDWKAMAWIDADVEFENPHWASDALKILNGGNDFIQLFTHAIDMDYSKNILNTFTGFGYQYTKNFKKGTGHNYWHPGFAWACNRKTYDKIGGIYQAGILGSGDNIMCHCIIKKAPETLKKGMDENHIKFLEEIQEKYDGVKLGYVPGNIRHHFHGKKENRKYYEREDILIDHKYNPFTFITTDSIGLIIPTSVFPKEFLKDIMSYFENRNEDEMVLEEIMAKPKDDKDVVKYKIDYIFSQFEKFKTDLVDVQDNKNKSVSNVQTPTISKSQPKQNTTYQQPLYQQPLYQQPLYQQPLYQQPLYQQSPYQQPPYQQLPYQQLPYQQPPYQQPPYQQPPYQQPPYQQQPYQQQQYQQSRYQQPHYVNPNLTDPREPYSKNQRFKGMSFK